jgi:hypothetical protein
MSEILGIQMLNAGVKAVKYKFYIIAIASFFLGVGITALTLYAIGWRMIW